VGSGDDSNIVGPVPDLPFRRSCRGLVVGGDRVLLAQHRIRDGGTVWLGLAAGPRKAGNSMRRYPASCRGEWPGDHRRPCAAARVGLDGRFSQYAGVRLCGARLERTQYAGGIRAGDEDRCDASDR
jgi:hypothetical protein